MAKMNLEQKRAMLGIYKAILKECIIKTRELDKERRKNREKYIRVKQKYCDLCKELNC